MNEFDPGEGWREVDQDEDARPVRAEAWVQWYDHGKSRRWVREVPVPPLPTEFGTVIKIGAWRFVLMDAIDACAWFLLCPNTREAAASMNRANVRAGAGYSPEFVHAEAEQHGGFEVLAVPVDQEEQRLLTEVQRETAKAVLDRVRTHVSDQGEDPDHEMFGLAVIAREFGVES